MAVKMESDQAADNIWLLAHANNNTKLKNIILSLSIHFSGYFSGEPGLD